MVFIFLIEVHLLDCWVIFPITSGNPVIGCVDQSANVLVSLAV